MSKHAFSSVIYRDDTRQVHSPSDLDVNWMSAVQRKSPLVQVKEPYGNLDMVTCRLSSCNHECTKCTKYTCWYRQGFFSAFWEHDPTPRIGNFRVVLYKIGKKHTL